MPYGAMNTFEVPQEFFKKPEEHVVNIYRMGEFICFFIPSETTDGKTFNTIVQPGSQLRAVLHSGYKPIPGSNIILVECALKQCKFPREYFRNMFFKKGNITFGHKVYLVDYQDIGFIDLTLVKTTDTVAEGQG
jgi:hypothetical protein